MEGRLATLLSHGATTARSTALAVVGGLVFVAAAAGSDGRDPPPGADYRDVTCRPKRAPTAAVVYLPRLTSDAPPFSYRRTLRHIRQAVGRLAAKGLPVFAYGESVGGNLAEMLAVRARVAGSIAVAAPSDLLTWPAEDRNYWRLLGMSRRERRAASPIHRIGPRPRPLLAVHSPEDDILPFDQSRRLARALPSARLIRLSGDHLEDSNAIRIALRWLRRRTQS